MARLIYRGAALENSTDLACRPYPISVKTLGDLTTAQVDSRIDTLLTPYPTAADVGARDALLATPAFVDAGDATRVPLSAKGAASGVAPLDNSGKIPPAYFSVASTQKWTRGPWTPPGYPTDPVSVTGTETTLYTCPVADPGWAYKLVVFGQADGAVGGDDIYPVINVRAGSATGTVIARGLGAADGTPTLLMGDDFNRPSSSNLGPGWNVTYPGRDGNPGVAITLNGEAYMRSAGALENNTSQEALCQRVDPATRYTGTNHQRIALTTGGVRGGVNPDTQDKPHFRMYFRANDAFTQYVAWEVDSHQARLIYNTGDDSGDRQVSATTASIEWDMNTTWYGYAGGDRNNLNERLFSLYKGDALVLQITDSLRVTPLGAANRGWGFGLRNSLYFAGQQTAPSIEQVYVTDFGPPYEPTAIVPYNLHDGSTTLTGPTTLYVTAQRSVSSSYAVTMSTYRPQLFVQAVPV
jgi:hypothetical protein